MNCKNCGSLIPDDAKFCTVCGSKIEVETPAVNPISEAQNVAEVITEAPVAEIPAEPVYTAPVVEPAPVQNKLPEEYEPLSPWAYWGYKLLFSVPIVGFVFLIVFSCKKSNINRRNFARSYWCDLILAAVALLIFILIAVLGGLGMRTVSVNLNF